MVQAQSISTVLCGSCGIPPLNVGKVEVGEALGALVDKVARSRCQGAIEPPYGEGRVSV